MPTVFFSYRHEDASHRQRVRDTAERVRTTGVEVILDQFYLEEHPAGPPEGWEIWSEHQARDAAFVLVVASESYARCYSLDNTCGEGLGVIPEAFLIRRRVRAESYSPQSVRVIVLQAIDKIHVPEPLAHLHHFCAYEDADFKGLIEWITNSKPRGKSAGSKDKFDKLQNQIPPAPQTFTGRTIELEMLRSFVLCDDDSKTIRCYGVQGQGGVGKTAIIRRFCEELSDRFPEGRCYLDLQGYSSTETPLNFRDFLAHVVRSFDPTEQLPVSDEALRQKYQQHLKNKRVLLVADNIAEQANLELLIPPPGSLLLLTSRETLLLAGYNPVRIGELTTHDARNLLRRLCPRLSAETDVALLQLARTSGNLPLALESNATTLQLNRLLSVSELCCRLEGLNALTDPVEAALQVSYERLASDDLRHAWRSLSVFPADFDVRAAAAVWGNEDSLAIDKLGALERASLLLMDELTGRLRFHDLGRIFAVKCVAVASDDQVVPGLNHALFYHQILREIASSYVQGGESVLAALKRFDLERKNIESGWQWAATMTRVRDLVAGRDALDIPKLSVPRGTRISGPLAAAYRVLLLYPLEVPGVFALRYQPLALIAWLETSAAVAVMMRERPNLGRLYGLLSNSWSELENFQKAGLYAMQQVGIARETKDKKGEIGGLVGLGNCLIESKQIDGAISCHKEALRLAQDLKDERAEATIYGCLGQDFEALGRMSEAANHLNRAVVLVRQNGDKATLSTVLSNLSSVYARQAFLHEAVQFAEDALQICRELGDIESESAALHNLANRLWQRGDQTAAIARMEESISIKGGVEDRWTKKSRALLAKWYQQASGTQ